MLTFTISNVVVNNVVSVLPEHIESQGWISAGKVLRDGGPIELAPDSAFSIHN